VSECSIINDIVDISKIEAGLMEVNVQQVNINKQIEFIYLQNLKLGKRTALYNEKILYLKEKLL
jgi:hypothetical protein